MWTCRLSNRACVLYVCVLYLTHLNEPFQHIMSSLANALLRCHRVACALS